MENNEYLGFKSTEDNFNKCLKREEEIMDEWEKTEHRVK